MKYYDSVNQWVIFDAYKAYEHAKEEKEAAAEKEELEASEGFVKQKPTRRRLLEPMKNKTNDGISKKMVRAGKILERMVNQNSCFDIAQGMRRNNICYNKENIVRFPIL